MDEAEAIAQLKSGDITALRTLVEIYQVQAVQVAVLITQDRATAEDIVQNAFLRSYERIAQFDSSRPFRPWFLRMVTNDALKTVAKQKRHVSLEAREDETYQHLVDYLDTTLNAPEDIVQRNEVREAIRKAFYKLSPQQKEAIILRYYLGFDEREMSAQMNIASGTVKWHLNAARKRLRSLLLPFAK